ncbi:MAG: DNA polymerase III subunit delta [Candidatus Atribacteria bacterium]|nr:DNA polymerase III subunit delta [Candidatus Atribacteria bacterium]
MNKFAEFDFFQLQKDISHELLKPVYLIYGEEEYLHDMILGAFKERLQKEGQDFNYELFHSENVKPGDFIDAVSNLTLGAKKRFIVLKNIEQLKNSYAKKIEFTLNHLSFKDNDRLMLFFSLSKKLPTNISIDKIRENGVIAHLQKPKLSQVRQWIQMKCRENKKTITSEAVYYLQISTDNDLGKIRNEIEKIFCYLGETQNMIDKEVASKMVYGMAGGNIFDFVDAVGERKKEKALSLLKVLEDEEVHPLSILAMISRQIKLILQVKINEGKNEKMKGELNLPSFVIHKLISQSKNYQLAELKNIFQYLMDAEEKIKTGYFDPVLVLEQLIIKIVI